MAKQIWWLVQKDLTIERRMRQAWPSMLLWGVIVAAVFSLQTDVPPAQVPGLAGGLLWLAMLFAGLIVIEHTSALELQDDCWEGLSLYPVSPTGVYVAKLTVNVMALWTLTFVLVPLFVILAGVPLLRHPWAMVLVAMLGGLGMAAVGTLVSTLAHGLRQRGALLSLLLTPLIVPVLLAAAEATRLIAEGDLGEPWWRWIQLLTAFAIVFTTAGMVLFEFLIEE